MRFFHLITLAVCCLAVRPGPVWTRGRQLDEENDRQLAQQPATLIAPHLAFILFLPRQLHILSLCVRLHQQTILAQQAAARTFTIRGRLT